MFLVASCADGITDKKVGNASKNMNGWIRKEQNKAEKAWCKFRHCEIRAHRSD